MTLHGISFSIFYGGKELFDDVFSDSVVTTGVYFVSLSSRCCGITIVCRVFFSGDELFGME